MIEINEDQGTIKGITKTRDIRTQGMIKASITDSRPVRFDERCQKNRPSKPKYQESES